MVPMDPPRTYTEVAPITATKQAGTTPARLTPCCHGRLYFTAECPVGQRDCFYRGSCKRMAERMQAAQQAAMDPPPLPPKETVKHAGPDGKEVLTLPTYSPAAFDPFGRIAPPAGPPSLALLPILPM
jgi:hypothetical protein